MSFEIQDLKQWIGRSETRIEQLGPYPATALAATLNRSDGVFEAGMSLPPLWHWLHFLPASRLDETGTDGHPARGGFLPPVPLPRRMWAGSRLEFMKPLHIGETCRRISTVTKVERKAGTSGDLIFVTVRHEVIGETGSAISEEQDIVYRAAAMPGAATPPPVQAPADAAWSYAIVPDPVLLFRYSALTYNSHRIHYDLDYATREEGYPGLVVQGPLVATLLLDGLSRAMPKVRITRFAFRAMAPTFHIDPFAVHGAITGPGNARLWAEKQGTLTMNGSADFI